jgi:hypothetical protein
MDAASHIPIRAGYHPNNDMCGAKRNGYLFMAAGCMFFLAACFGKQAAFYALAAYSTLSPNPMRDPCRPR